MSLPSIIFTVYLCIGLLLMVAALISDIKQKAARAFDPLVDGTALGAGVMLLIALLWPVWLIAWLTKKEDEEQKVDRHADKE